jgi:hypothetical protein
LAKTNNPLPEKQCHSCGIVLFSNLITNKTDCLFIWLYSARTQLRSYMTPKQER